MIGAASITNFHVQYILKGDTIGRYEHIRRNCGCSSQGEKLRVLVSISSIFTILFQIIMR